jgi:hypothetical protein
VASWPWTARVPSAAQQRAVEDIARRVPGVRAVVDDLDVRPPGTPVPDEIRLACEALDALDRKARAPAGRIQVIVHDGRVRLEGTVDSPGEKEAAEAAVGDVVLGWGSVENTIVVRPGSTPEPTEEGTEDVPRGEDDFDTLRIDPGPEPGNGMAIERRERRPRPGREGLVAHAATDRMKWLDE